MIISFFRKLITSPRTQALWDEALPDFQTIINSASSSARNHSPFFLTFFRYPNFPFQALIQRKPNLDEASSVAARLNFSTEILLQAAEHLRAESSLTKEQFDKQVFLRSFPIGCKVYVRTSERFGLSKKMSKPFKGPYVCLQEGKNGNLHLLPIGGGRTIHVHKNNCKLAPYRSQHLLAHEDPDLPEDNSPLPPSKNRFKYSAFDPQILDEGETPEADVSDELNPPAGEGAGLEDPDIEMPSPPGSPGTPDPPPDHRPTAPPMPPDLPPIPTVPPAPGPNTETGSGTRPKPPPVMPTDYRQNEPPGPPRTRRAAQAPHMELPDLPGIGYEKTSLERFLSKKLVTKTKPDAAKTKKTEAVSRKTEFKRPKK